MNFLNIAITVLVMAVLAAVLGFALSFASKVFAVKKDPRIEHILNVLPGANCGGCGYAGCGDYAEKIVSGEAPLNKCPVGAAKATREISEIMGVEASGVSVRMRAQVMCSGTNSLANRKYNYLGIDDCLSVAKLGNGPKECSYGCIGLGTCVKVCNFNAIKVEKGVAVVKYEKCVACGMCVSSCPQNLIRLIPSDSDVWVGCNSHDKGSVVRTFCKVGCIGCGLCMKSCPTGAISVIDGIASIDYDKCINCGVCVEKCPRKIIWSGKKQTRAGGTIDGIAFASESIEKELRKVKNKTIEDRDF